MMASKARQPAELDPRAMDQLFLKARTQNAWSSRDVGEDLIRRIYEVAKWGPTSANSNPARFLWVKSLEAKERLARYCYGKNAAKIAAAPVTVIIGRDLDFVGRMEELFPHSPTMRQILMKDDVRLSTAIRNTTLQGAYLMISARAHGLDCGPMSGFDADKVKEAFFAERNVEPDFICSMGYGTGEEITERLPRLSFEHANEIV